MCLNESDEKFSLIIVQFGSFSSNKEEKETKHKTNKKNQMNVITVFIHADVRDGSDSVRLCEEYPSWTANEP